MFGATLTPVEVFNVSQAGRRFRPRRDGAWLSANLFLLDRSVYCTEIPFWPSARLPVEEQLGFVSSS